MFSFVFLLSNYEQCLFYMSTNYIVLSLFTVVQWDQSLCQAPTGEYGSCVPNNDCIARGGIAGGPCAGGYGMCCVCMCCY